ncbi:MAG: hypothetical protein AB1898_05700 [Acidobacteriota bacterium]
MILLVHVYISSVSWAGYKGRKVTVGSADSYPHHQVQGTVTIAADPYESQEKIKSAFDLKDLLKRNIVPINVIISNQGDEAIVIEGEHVELFDPRGRSFSSLPPEEVVQLLINKDRPLPTQAPRPGRFPIPDRGGLRGDWFEIQTDLINKSLGDLRVLPKSTGFGFVFFRVLDYPVGLREFRLYLPKLRNLKTGEDLLFFEIEIQ